MSSSSTFAVAGLALLISGCGGSGDGQAGGGTFPADTTCGLSLQVGGAATASVTPATSVACVTQVSFNPGLSAMMVPVEGSLKRVELDVDDIEAGQLGTFPLALSVEHQDGRTWQGADCAFEVTDHRHMGSAEMGQEWRALGSGGCAEALASTDDGTLDVVALEVVVSITWAD